MDIRGFFVPSSSNSHSVNSSSSKRKGSNDGDPLQSSASSGKRNFVRIWTKYFPWLEYDGEKMRCKPCSSRTTESYSSSVLVTGSTNLKIESIRSHEKSNGHNRAVIMSEYRQGKEYRFRIMQSPSVPSQTGPWSHTKYCGI